MTKKLFAKPLVRKLIIFSSVFAFSVVIAAGNMFANRYDVADAMSIGVISTPTASDAIESDIKFLPVPTAYTPDSETGIWDYIEPVSGVYIDEYYREDIPDAELMEKQKQQEEEAAAYAVRRSAAHVNMEDFVYSPDIPLSEELQRYTYEQCIVNELDYELVLALMWRESRFQLEAVHYNRNGTMDSGVMQINDVNRGWLKKELGITDLLDPWQNIEAGTTLLGRFTRKYGEHNALMAYQYGESGMERKLSQGVTTNKQIELLYAKREDFESLFE
ncbi:MAG: lytic transglycosylase domain-containing protein [Oscillospiraceae bacterium]|jgi:soluble lytic murein transglycosylase-like protein|nr:lytic transglycosylase domain-containing protein [Oscillospiraceae bacterium]